MCSAVIDSTESLIKSAILPHQSSSKRDLHIFTPLNSTDAISNTRPFSSEFTELMKYENERMRLKNEIITNKEWNQAGLEWNGGFEKLK